MSPIVAVRPRVRAPLVEVGPVCPLPSKCAPPVINKKPYEENEFGLSYSRAALEWYHNRYSKKVFLRIIRPSNLRDVPLSHWAGKCRFQ